VLTCNDICDKIPGVISYRCGKKQDNLKVCIDCEIAFPYEGIFCPCCGRRVRYHSRRPMKYQGVRY
jgi:predicted amidophosphoribosyltransferase